MYNNYEETTEVDLLINISLVSEADINQPNIIKIKEKLK